MPVLVRNVIAPLVLHLAERVRVHVRLVEDWLHGWYLYISRHTCHTPSVYQDSAIAVGCTQGASVSHGSIVRPRHVTDSKPAMHQVWNPVSRSQTRSMYGVLENLMQVYLQPKDKNLQVRHRSTSANLTASASRILLFCRSFTACFWSSTVDLQHMLNSAPGGVAGCAAALG